MLKLLRRKSKAAVVQSERKAEFKPKAVDVAVFLKQIKCAAFGKPLCTEHEGMLGEWLEKNGYVVLDKVDGHGKPYAAPVARLTEKGERLFSCEGCLHFKRCDHSWKLSSGAVSAWRNVRYCEKKNKVLSQIADYREVLACESWMPKVLMEAFS